MRNVSEFRHCASSFIRLAFFHNQSDVSTVYWSDIASKVGISSADLSRISRGVSVPRCDTFFAILNALGYTVELKEL